MSVPNTLKALHVKSGDLALEIKALEQQETELVKRKRALKQELNEVNSQIAELTVRKPVVTEHALLRYVERVLGVDLEKIESEILSEENCKLIDFAGNCKIKANGVIFVVRDRHVVSVVK